MVTERITQEPARVLEKSSTQDERITQLPVRTLEKSSTTDERITQLPVRSLTKPNNQDARITQLPVRIARSNVSPINFMGFETGDLSEVSNVVQNTGNTIAVSTSHRNTQVPSQYSCHLTKTAVTSNQCQFNVPGLNSDGTQNPTTLTVTSAYVRCYFYFVSITATSGTTAMTPLITLYYGAGGSLFTVELWVNSSGVLVVQDATGGFHTGSTTLSLNTYYRLDFSVNSQTGAYTARINGTQELSGTTSSTIPVYTIQIGGQTGSQFEYYVDDIFVDANFYPPNGGSYCFVANGNGANTAWTGTASSTVPPNSTGAITSTATGNIRSVLITPQILSGAVINAVKPNAYVEAATAANSLAVHLHSGSSDTDTSGATSLSTVAYTPLANIYAIDPNTSSAWTVSGTNGAQPGVKNITQGSSGTSSCEALYLVVDFVGNVSLLTSGQYLPILGCGN